DAEGPIGRVRLVPVLRDPQVLRPVQLLDQPEQDADVPERDRVAVRLRRRGLALRAVVGMVRVDVEAAHPVLLARAEEDERRDGRAEAPGQVVAARRGDAAADLLALDPRPVYPV